MTNEVKEAKAVFEQAWLDEEKAKRDWSRRPNNNRLLRRYWDAKQNRIGASIALDLARSRAEELRKNR